MDAVDRALTTWLREGPERGPADGLEQALAETRRVEQRPGWLVAERWLPFDRGGGRLPTARTVAIVLTLIALVLALCVALAVGSQRRVPAPFGPAANGSYVYDTGPGGGIYITDRDGGNPRRIEGGLGIERSPVFSPDGTRFAFWSRVADGSGIGEGDPCTCQFSLFVANADGSAARNITGNRLFHLNPSFSAIWSPDSTRLAFFADNGGVNRIYVVPADGSSPPVAITDATAGRMGGDWSPNGEWIAFSQDSIEAPWVHAIGLVHPDGSEPRILRTQRFAGDPADEAGFGGTLSWSIDSRHLAYARGTDPDGPERPYAMYLAVVDLDGAETTLAHDVSGFLFLPIYSPDGTQIAFITGEQQNEEWVVGADGKGRHLVGECLIQDRWMDWSPDGRTIFAACANGPEIMPVASGAVADSLPAPSGVFGIDRQRVAP
jgi:dipeptidyl aminopeptidase/acylaminoacyl peptidase